MSHCYWTGYVILLQNLITPFAKTGNGARPPPTEAVKVQPCFRKGLLFLLTMLRYTTIHHDVRKKFGLTISEYMVADSIMQQTKYGEVCKQSTSAMAAWLSLEESTVRKAKHSCIEKGVIQAQDNGYIYTEDFFNSVRFSRIIGVSDSETGKNPAKTGKNPDDSIYINKINNSEQSSHVSDEDLDDVQIEEVDDDGTPLKKPKKKGNAHLEVFKCFGEKIPPSWFRNTTIIKSARGLLEERGIEQIRKAVSFYEENRNEPFIPEIITPYDLDMKWEKLLAFKKRKS